MNRLKMTFDERIAYYQRQRKEREERWAGHPIYAVAREFAGAVGSRLDYWDTMAVSIAFKNMRKDNYLHRVPTATFLDWLRDPRDRGGAIISPYGVWEILWDLCVISDGKTVEMATGKPQSYWDRKLGSINLEGT